MKKLVIIPLILLAVLFSAPLSLVKADDQKLNADDIKLADGYKIEPVVSHLSVPTTLIFDGSDMLVAESGFVDTAKPRVLRIKPDGTVTVLAKDGLTAPVTGLLVNAGRVYVSHKGKVSIIQPDGTLKDIVTGLPSDGDHQNNQLAMGPDGKIYLGQGTVTNSGVIGEDNYIFGWLKKGSQVHEVPCKDITLVGQNFETGNPLTEDDNDEAATGAYKPFGAPSREGEVIKGDVKCGGSVLRFNPDGSGLELVAWGMRNPFGLEFDKSGQLWTTYHGADVRGSRNIYNDTDYLIKVQQDGWYGWPEYFDGLPVTDNRFNDPLKVKPQFLWKDHPPLAKAFATFVSHSAANGIAFSSSDEFGFNGDLFVAMYGTFAPVTTGTNAKPAGFRVGRVDMRTGEVLDFAENKLPGPAYLNLQAGFNRPSDVTFGPDNALYVVDWGAAKVTADGIEEVAGTGSIWRVYSQNQGAIRPNGPMEVSQDGIPEDQHKPLAKNSPELYKMLSPQIISVIVVAIILLGAVLYLAYRLRKKK